ncbi:phosphoribosyltransferase family protein [Microbacterium sp. NPDC089188]|uniref:ComF family protein n=1 Tax=unclassified Microbacterium TaxID=2609290 RepID=UPI00343ABFCA
MDPRSLLADAARDALTFWLPVACAGCDALDTALCEGCRRALAPQPVRRVLAPELTVTSALVFAGPTARIIRGLKEDGRTALASALAPALRAVLGAIPPEAVITTVPSTRAAFRRRGYRPVELILRRAGHRDQRVLRLRRAPRDQRGLDRDARRLNVGGAFVARGVTGLPVVVVDDVVTTGATLLEAARALRDAGAATVVAVTLAHTPRRGGL